MAENAENQNAAEAQGGGSEKSSGQKPVLLMALVVVNMLVIVGFGVMMYLGKRKKPANPTLMM